MFSKIHLKNFGAFSEFNWPNLGRVNVVVGENDTGKSHLLKAMYVIAKSVEAMQKRTTEEHSWNKLLLDKLRWTFQPRSGVGSLIRHGAREAEAQTVLFDTPAHFRIRTEIKVEAVKPLGIKLPRKTTRVSGDMGHLPAKGMSAIFLPPKEILSTFSAIAVTRESHEIFGFDDTYYDLIKMLRVPPTQGAKDPHLSRVLDDLHDLFGGRIVKAQSSDEFSFERGELVYGMSQTADGIKKIGILTTLIENRSLKPRSVIFLDEPETNLHPKAITYLTRMLFSIGRAGAQVFLATHSYLVIKQLQILAKKFGESVPFCSLVRQGDDVIAALDDLRDGMPDNPIIEESLRLYREEIDVDLGTRG